MIHGVSFLLTFVAVFWLTACGGGSGAQDEAGQDEPGTISHTDATGQSPSPEPVKTPTAPKEPKTPMEVAAKDEAEDAPTSPGSKGPRVPSLADQIVIATENLSLVLKVEDSGDDSLSFACILDCPSGLTVDAESGAVSWRPQPDQVGEVSPIFQVSANGRVTTTSLRILVVAPSFLLSGTQLMAVSGETVAVRPTVQSNLKDPYQWSLMQISGPQVTLAGQDGEWTFTAPAVPERTSLSFDLKIGNGLYIGQHLLHVVIDPTPVAPTVAVGGDRVSRAAFTVSAAVSPNATALLWTSQGPGQVTFSDPQATETTISADADGVYHIELTAMNSSGQTGKSSFQLTWDTEAPQIDAGPDVASAQALSRTAQVQGATTYAWSKVSGPGVLQFSPSHATSTVITADQDGDYVIQLTATDAAGNVSVDSFSWHYDHTPPTVSLGEPIIMTGKIRALSASISDDAVTIQWKKVSGPLAVSFAPDNQRDTTVTLAGEGAYILEVSASDALGNTASAQQQVFSDTLPPQITGVNLGSVLADGYLNPMERSRSEPLIDAVLVQDSSPFTLGYKVVGSSSTCTSSLEYKAEVPRSDDPMISKAGSYKVCVKATDSINLNAYAASAKFTYDTTVVSVTVSGLPTDPGRDTSMYAVVAGKSVSHYKSKLGPSASTDCSSDAGYSTEAPVATPITYDYASQSDGQLRLCVIGRTAAGNWQDLSLAFRHDWTLDRAVPGDPSSLRLDPMVARTRLSWDAVPNADSYLVIRSEDGVVTWTPTSGHSYAAGDEIDDSAHQVVAVVSQGLVAYDDSAEPGRSYHYALFAFDRALNYNLNPGRGSAAPLEPLPFNKADGFDRLVRVVLPIHEGVHKGKIMVGGDFLVYRSHPAIRLLRLNADYTLDTSFKAATINNSVYSIALADDGSIYIGGTFTTVDGKARNRIARLTSSGALDENFTPSGFNSTVYTVALSHDQSRVYVGGAFTTVTTTPATPMNRIAALRTYDGALDAEFEVKANAELELQGFNGTVWTILPEPGSSEIYVGGQFTDYGGEAVSRLVKLDASGAIDSSLNIDTGFNNTVVTLAMDSRQRLYAGGSFTRYKGSSYYQRLIRLKTDGTPDAEFSKGLSSTPRFNNTIYAIELDEANQRVYVGGAFTLLGTAPLSRLARLSMVDGTLDTTLSAGTNGNIQTLGLTDQGTLIGGGNFQSYGEHSTAFFFAAESTDGALDQNSPRGSNLNSYVYAATKVFENGNALKYFLAGSFTAFNGETVNRVVKLDREGQRDRSFNSQVTNGNVYAIAWDETENKLYVGGTFTQVNGVARNRIARLNADGSLDTSFEPDGFDSDVYAIALATLPVTGTRVIYVGGKFTKSGTASVGRLMRLGTDGKADPNFVTGTGFDNNVAALAVVPSHDDHAVYVGGSFTKYNSSLTNAPRLVKLASDGGLASGFEPGTGFNGSVQALVWVPGEDALYVGGAFSRYQTTIVANRIAKLDRTGAMAAGFTATGFNSPVYALAHDAENDVIWAGGSFTTFRSIPQVRMAAMARDGSRIAAFAAPVGFNNTIRAIVPSTWGAIAGGLASSYDGVICGFVARLHVNASMD